MIFGARGSGSSVVALAVFLVAAVLSAPAPALAEWQQVPVPPGGVGGLFAATPDSLLSQPSHNAVAVTADRGSTWHSVGFSGFSSVYPLGAAPDDSFRALALRFDSGGQLQLQVFRVEPSGSVVPLGPLITSDSDSMSSLGAALSGAGAVWVPTYDEGDESWDLDVVSVDGALTSWDLPDLGAVAWYPRDSVLGPRVVPFGGPGFSSWQQRDRSYRLANGIEPAEAYPVEFADGDFWFSPWTGQASWDGGAHWAEAPELAGVVPREHAPPRFLAVDGAIVEPFSSFLYRAAGSPFPGESVLSALDAGGALFAYNQTAIYVEPLPLAPYPPALGQIPPDSAEMIARANTFRADAGLPPLTGDARISQAALNHTRYTALNHVGVDAGLGAHSEDPGRPGFTGRDLVDRCEAVGVHCTGEVMYSPVADPVGGWLATPYHRFVPGAPEFGLVGGGKADGGWYVMNSGSPLNLLIRPFGYPNGRWRGEDGFAGETPDPVESCNRRGIPIAYPIGIGVSLYLPTEFGGDVSRIDVRRRGAAMPLPGCLLDASTPGQTVKTFILDDPLVAGATYDVDATWTTGPQGFYGGGGAVPGPVFRHGWSFYFDPDNYGVRREPRPCAGLGLRRVESIAPSRRPGAALGLEERIRFKQAAKARLSSVRFTYWSDGDPHRLKLKLGKRGRHWVSLRKTSYLRLRLPARVARQVEPGEKAELRLAFAGRRKSGCARQTRFTRVRKVEIGWVRSVGPVSWSSRPRRH